MDGSRIGGPRTRSSEMERALRAYADSRGPGWQPPSPSCQDQTKEGQMSTCKDRKCAIVMKLSHFLGFYENTKGVSLCPERAEEEATKCGVIIDHSGEVARGQ